MVIVTILSMMLCGEPNGLPEGECETVSSQRWEAGTFSEADDDWAACLDKRAQKLGRYDEVECDQDEEDGEL